MGFIFQLQKTLPVPLSSHNQSSAGTGEQEESQGCWGRAGLQLGGDADLGGENSEFTSSGFVFEKQQRQD